MLAPYRWIRDYADVRSDAKALADKMVMTGNGVEGIAYLGEDIVNVVVGKIEKIEKHPDADKLLVCAIDVGDGAPLQIVTGAANVFEGAYVPVAKAVATLPGGTIKKGKLRGVESFGMLCSGEELNLKEEDYEGAGVDGILILQGEPEPGADVCKLLELDGAVIEFEIGANRPDCLSVMGIAREAAAADEVSFREPETSYAEQGQKTEDIVQVEVKDSDLCTRYIAAAVTDVKIGPSPMWMRLRLREAGIRPINNIVDITNYVMVETGQPMHAFDAADIRGGEIIVRRAAAGEKMTTLDEKPREFTENMLLICDAEGPIGVAGVMGGQDSEIKRDTQTVVFEAAKFGYWNIRQTSRALGLSTESSMRFSKGIDAAMTMFALKRALTLVEQLGAGKVAKGVIDILHEDISPRIVKTTSTRVNALLGTSISAKKMQQLLNRVFIQTGCIGDELICTVPSFRGDIVGAADIAEEVARIYGYDNIPATSAQVRMRRGVISPVEAKSDIIKRYLADEGFCECATYSFIGEQEYRKLGMELPNSVKLLNPLGDDTAYMRVTLAAHMLSVAAFNLSRKNKELDLFEISRVYIPVAGEQLPHEIPALCMVQTGNDNDFFTLKGIVENIVRLVAGAEVTCTRAQTPYLHPGASADIRIGGACVGVMGEVAPAAAKAFELEQKVYMAQVDLQALFAIGKPAVTYRELPKYPAAERDIAVMVDAAVGAGDMIEEIKAAGGNRLEAVELFDVYTGEQVEAGKKSVAYALTLRAADATLTDAEVDSAVERILKRLDEKFGAKLR